jgi:hypothetical protein
MTDSSGRPLRWVPRQHPPASSEVAIGFEPGEVALPRALQQQPAGPLPTLPPEARDLESALLLLNGMRDLLLAAGMAREES